MSTSLPTPKSTDQDDLLAFYVERVGSYARFVALASSTFLVVPVALHATAFGMAHAIDMVCRRSNAAHVASTLLSFACWQIARRARLSPRGAIALDSVGTSLTCFGLTGAVLDIPGDRHPELLAMLILMTVLVGRAGSVPSTGTRTALIGVASTLGLLVLAYHLHGATAGGVASDFVNVILWCGMAVVSSALTSRKIYGLETELRQAQKLGQYTLETKLGGGGMGEVYRARHALLRRPTAVKLLSPDRRGPLAIQRFEREVQLTSQLTHPATIQVYDYGKSADGLFYYAMELIDGLTLEELVDRHGAQSPGRVIRILEQVCGSLAEAHSVGLVHRDVKPANIMLTERGGLEDVVKVLDFGLVKEIEQAPSTALSATTTITGTPLYLSPEAIRDPESIDARSDLYAVGAVGYYLLVGDHVFEGRSVVEVCSHHLHTKPVPPSERRAGVPEDLERVLLACLEKSPDKRPSSASALREALLACGAASSWSESEARAFWAQERLRADAKRPEAKEPSRRTLLATRAVDAA